MSLQSLSRLAWAGRRWWALGLTASALALVALVASAGAAPEPPKKDEPKKEEPKKDAPKKEEPKKEDKKSTDELFPDLDDLLKDLPLDPAMKKMMREQMRRSLEQLKGQGVDADQIKQMREHMRQAMQQMRRQFQGRPGGFPIPFPGGFPGMPGMPGHAEGRLGARVESPSPTLVDQLDLPKGQGLVIESVAPDSAAAKAGIKPHDILLEVNGKAVPNSAPEFVKMLADVKPDTTVDAVVLRKGKKETIKGLKLPEAKAVPPGFPGGGIPFPNFPMPPGGGFPPGGFPGFPGLPGGQGATTIIRNGDQFTAKSQQGPVTIVVTGKVTDGKAKVEGVAILAGDKTDKYESLDKVPEQYRARARALADMAEKAEKSGGLEFEKKPLKKEF